MSNTAAAKAIEFHYPQSCKEFTEEQLRQHMRIPGAIWKEPASHPRRRAALVGVPRPSAAYQTVSFGAAREWANDEEGWEEVKPRFHSKKWKGSAVAAMEH